jgi:NAD+ synthase
LARLADLTLELVAWLRGEVDRTGTKGLIVGVSGGLDSAVVAALIKRAMPDGSMGLILPCHSAPEDCQDARLVCEAFDLTYGELDLTPAHQAILEPTLRLLPHEGARRSADANLRARLRMCTLYTAANALGYLVVGTDNAAEYWTGYFTKYGDGGCDLLPLAQFTKAEVRKLADFLGVPAHIIHKTPSAGLWPGQTDEAEMGVSYTDIDGYLQGAALPGEIVEKLLSLHRQTEHKRRTPTVFQRPWGKPPRLD